MKQDEKENSSSGRNEVWRKEGDDFVCIPCEQFSTSNLVPKYLKKHSKSKFGLFSLNACDKTNLTTPNTTYTIKSDIKKPTVNIRCTSGAISKHN